MGIYYKKERGKEKKGSMQESKGERGRKGKGRKEGRKEGRDGGREEAGISKEGRREKEEMRKALTTYAVLALCAGVYGVSSKGSNRTTSYSLLQKERV